MVGTRRRKVIKKEVYDCEQIDTVHTLAAAFNALTIGGIRWTIFQHKETLQERGAIFYLGRKLMIDRSKYLEAISGVLSDRKAS